MPEEPNNTPTTPPSPQPEVEPASGQSIPVQSQAPAPVVAQPTAEVPQVSPQQTPQAEAPAPAAPEEPAPVQQPAPTQEPVAVGSPAPKKSGKEKLVIAGVIIAVLALLGGGAAYAYFGWYQNPDKVVTDGLVNTLSSTPGSVKMNMSYKAGDTNVSLSVDAKGNDKIADATLNLEYASGEQNVSLKGTANMIATDSGTVYLKLNNVRDLAGKAVDALVESQAAQYMQFGFNLTEAQIAQQKQATLTQLEPVITKIDNKWIKFSADKKSSTSEDQKCVHDAFNKLQTDRATRDEIGKVYADNKFVIIKEQLGLKDGSYGYVLDLEREKAKSFGKAAESTQFAKDLKKCSDSPTSSGSSRDNSDNFENTRVELWVSQWSHQITGLKVETTYTEGSEPGELTFDMTIGYDKAGKITEPTDAVDAETLMNDLYSVGGGTPTPRTSGLSI